MSADDESGARGPSWWDVQEMLAYVMRRHHRRANIVLAMITEPFNEKITWTVTAQSWESGKYEYQNVIGASAPFKGNAGAKTVTAAIHRALCELNEKLDERQREAERQARF